MYLPINDDKNWLKFYLKSMVFAAQPKKRKMKSTSTFVLMESNWFSFLIFKRNFSPTIPLISLICSCNKRFGFCFCLSHFVVACFSFDLHRIKNEWNRAFAVLKCAKNGPKYFHTAEWSSMIWKQTTNDEKKRFSRKMQTKRLIWKLLSSQQHCWRCIFSNSFMFYGFFAYGIYNCHLMRTKKKRIPKKIEWERRLLCR